MLWELVQEQSRIEGAQSFASFLRNYCPQLFHAKEVFVNNPSSKALIRIDQNISIWKIISLVIAIFAFVFLIWRTISFKTDPFIYETLAIQGDKTSGSKLFKINCVGCHGITAQGLVGPDLNDVTDKLNDKEIINQIIKGRTPPMPSFEIEAQSMADLLSYMHSLE